MSLLLLSSEDLQWYFARSVRSYRPALGARRLARENMSWADPQLNYRRPAAASSTVGHHGTVDIAAAVARWSESSCPSLIGADASARAFPARRWSRLEAFLLKIRAQQAVHVVALGSSMTLGKECDTDAMSAVNPQPRHVESKAGRSLGQPEA